MSAAPKATQASTYQRLRGHLAVLRLTAAAEALPAELERATAEPTGHTAFLERLLAVEVAAAEARRQASLARFACLPAPWRLVLRSSNPVQKDGLCCPHSQADGALTSNDPRQSICTAFEERSTSVPS